VVAVVKVIMKMVAGVVEVLYTWSINCLRQARIRYLLEMVEMLLTQVLVVVFKIISPS
jgi:hypothetical protein